MSQGREIWWTAPGGEPIRERFRSWRSLSLEELPGVVSHKPGRSRERAVLGRAELGLVGEGKILVKIYRPRSLRKALTDRAERGRAEREWRNAHEAASAGIRTVLPLAAARRRGIAEGASFIAYPYLDGHVDIEAFLLRRAMGEPRESGRQKRRLLEAIGQYAREIHDRGIDVLDFHVQQFLLSEEDLAKGMAAPILIDLEKARVRRRLRGRDRYRMLVRLDTTLCEAGARACGGVNAADRLRVLRAYFRPGNPFPAVRRTIQHRVLRAGWRRFQRDLRKWGGAGLPHAGLPVETPKLPVSCFIICFNEERYIRDCLESVRWCDEIVVVDSFSRDRTIQICREFTDRVIERKWPGFVEQKRFALEQTRNEWVLNLDADERVSPELRDEIFREIRKNDPETWGYYIPRLVWFLGRWWRHGWYPEYRLRLFRRSRVTWGGVDPHEKAFLDDERKARKLRGDIWHLTYEDLGDQIRTANRFSSIAAREMMGRGKKLRLWNLFLNPFIQFFRFYILKRGFLEGLPGFFVAILVANNVFLKYAKYWDIKRTTREQGGGGPGR